VGTLFNATHFLRELGQTGFFFNNFCFLGYCTA